MPGPTPIILPSREHLLECFSYDPDTGSLTWRIRPRKHFITQRAWNTRNARFAGKEAGHIQKSASRIVGFDYHLYLAHRIIWKMTTGEEPPETIDHRDRNPNNNRWKNLRPATEAEQKWNTRKRFSFTGRRSVMVDKRDGRIYAQLTVKGVRYNLGTFATIAEAGNAVDDLRHELHREFYAE